MHISYEGTSILELLTQARHYNLSITREILKASEGIETLTDFGAGIGTFAGLLRQAGRKIICVDIDKDHRQILSQAGFEAHASITDVSPVPSFIYTLNVLEHIQDDDRVMSEIFDFLEPGAKFFVYVPAMKSLWTDLDDQVGHFRRYSLSVLRQKLSHAGFHVEKIRYTDSAGVLATWLFKLLGKKSSSITRKNILFYDRVIFRISQLFDPLFHTLAGKNVMALAIKPSLRSEREEQESH